MCRYEDDKDEGEWFLYTGSGGRDLSGNKRTSKVPSPPLPLVASIADVRHVELQQQLRDGRAIVVILTAAIDAAQVQSFDQTFDKMNLALKLSCTKGLPVRVIRSYKVHNWNSHPSPAPYRSANNISSLRCIPADRSARSSSVSRHLALVPC